MVVQWKSKTMLTFDEQDAASKAEDQTHYMETMETAKTNLVNMERLGRVNVFTTHFLLV